MSKKRNKTFLLDGKPVDQSALIRKQDAEIHRLRETVERYSHERRQYIMKPATLSNTLRFGLVSDTHIGSLYERVDALAAAYDYFKRQGIKVVLHAGDMTDGHRVYSGHEFEVYAHGFDQSLEAVVQRYPRVKGIETHFIGGNHDRSFRKESGASVGASISLLRKDLIYLGDDYARIVFPTRGKQNYAIVLLHPQGGTPYAISYRSQKVVEAFSGGEKPNLVMIGHLHKLDYMPMFRNVQAFQLGCFQSQTPYMKRLSTPAHIGCWAVEVVVQGKKALSERVRAEALTFYEPEETS